MTASFNRLALVLAVFALSAAALANDDSSIGAQAFEKACSGCHGATPVARAPSREQLAKLPPERIFQAQTAGLMLLQAAALNEIEKRAVAIYLSATEWGSVAAAKASEKLVMCDSASPLAASAFEHPHWVGWGLDLDGTHSQPGDQAGLTAADLDKLELKWA